MSVVAMLATLATLAVGGALVAAGLLKLLRPVPVPAPMPVVRVPGSPERSGTLERAGALRALGALELCCGAGAIVLFGPAQIAAAALLWVFAGWLWREVARGRSGEACPCFAARTSIGVRSGGATTALAGVATALALGEVSRPSTVALLALACGLLAFGCLALGGIAFLLAREVSELRGEGVPHTALEILDEGPAVGRECPLIERFGEIHGEIALAVFLSPGCAICRELAPAMGDLAAQLGLELVVFDEQRDQLAWHSAAIPGSPYAVAMDRQGVTLAKGTFNTLEQLASVPATARLRRREGLARV